MPLNKPIASFSNDREKKDGICLLDIQPVSDRIATFPSTRYYGSKRKLLYWIYEKLKGYEFNSVLDGFGGTGSVSLLFKAMGKDVSYHDAFLFNSHTAKVVLSDEIKLSKKNFVSFLETVKPRNGVVSKAFDGLYYIKEENEWLDGLAQQLYSSNMSDHDLSVYIYTLTQASLQKRPFNLFHRANLNLRLNKNVKRNFGNSVTWERSFIELMTKSYKEVSGSIWKGKGDISILESDCVSNVKSGYDLVYLDPPYVSASNKNNSDHYWKKYHFLEGYCNYSNWESLIDRNSPLMSIKAPTSFIEWNQMKTFKERLFSLIEKHRNSIVVLSYVSNAYPEIEEIQALFESLFTDVAIHLKEHSHALSKQKKRELLFIGKP